ncbi:MAG: bifunctional nicotinamidase/pyrazinamidase [Wenzhouxiangella sp.]|jgi:nicotinamidase/pyrazinamidase|nr:bifunctional nicotinamidase/pyrazinamidase [Wenzhouxiangella sp.]
MNEAIKIKESDALLVIDVQNDFCAGGALEVQSADKVVAPINELTKRFSTVALSQDWHPAGHKSFHTAHADKHAFETVQMPYGEQLLWPEHCVAGTAGAEFHPDLDVSPAQAIIRKGTNPEVDSYSTFFENDRKTPTGMAGYLRQNQIKRIFLCGIATEYCVGFSALDGRSEGFDVFVISDATARFNNEDTEPMLAKWHEAGVVVTRSDCLDG